MTTTSQIRTKSFVDTRSLVFWVGLALSVYAVLTLIPLLTSSLAQSPAAGMLSAVIWGLYGLALAFVLYRLELFERRSPMTILGAFLWGGVIVAGIGVVAAPAMHDLMDSLLGTENQEWVSAISAGLAEEPLKMLGVIALAFIPGARINSALDGLFYGLIIGLGFEVTESFLYSVQGAAKEGGSLNIVVMTFLLRGVIGGLWSHPTFTGITGAGVGYFFEGRASAVKRWTAMLGALILAIALHAFFDSPILEGDVLSATILKGLPALVLFLFLFRFTRRRERRIFSLAGEQSVSPELISSSELDKLLTKKGRRQARRQLRKLHGFAASHALKRLQRSQTGLLAAVVNDGPESDRAADAEDDVREARTVLAEVTADLR